MLGKRLASVVLLAVAIGSLAACSGDDKDSGLSKEEFLKQATTICKDTKERIDQAGDELDPNDPNALTDYVVYTSAEVLEEIATLRDLGFPAGDEGTLNQAFAVYEKYFAQWQADPASAATTTANPELTKAGTTLEKYGLPACGADV